MRTKRPTHTYSRTHLLLVIGVTVLVLGNVFMGYLLTAGRFSQPEPQQRISDEASSAGAASSTQHDSRSRGTSGASLGLQQDIETLNWELVQVFMALLDAIQRRDYVVLEELTRGRIPEDAWKEALTLDTRRASGRSVQFRKLPESLGQARVLQLYFHTTAVLPPEQTVPVGLRATTQPRRLSAKEDVCEIKTSVIDFRFWRRDDGRWYFHEFN
jgi:hypothetical protein